MSKGEQLFPSPGIGEVNGNVEYHGQQAIRPTDAIKILAELEKIDAVENPDQITGRGYIDEQLNDNLRAGLRM